MLEIKRCSEYNARATNQPDFATKTPGYNFSYPVLNTIEICNLFISGGSVEIKIERSGYYTYTYNIDTKNLTIEHNGKTDTYYIINSNVLGEQMLTYYNANKDELEQKILETNQKKSKSKQGNQNAKKEDVSNSTCHKLLENTEPQKLDLSEYPIDFINNIAKIRQAVNNNPQNFCELEEYIQETGKSIGEYFYWLVGKGWLFRTNYATQHEIYKAGYNVQLALNREQTIYEAQKY